jgi:hypothetical protein
MYTRSDEHAQRIMGNDVIIIPQYDFENPSRWYYRMQEENNESLEQSLMA